MSHITLAQQGLAAVEAKRWDEAIAKLSRALKTSRNPAWLVARSKALAGAGRPDEALDDADLAWHTAFARNQRDQMAAAHYRRAVALFRSGRLADADCCCIYAMRLIKGFEAVEPVDPKARWADADGRWTATARQAMDEAAADPFNKPEPDRGLGRMAEAQAKAQAKAARVAEWRLASTLRVQILTRMDALPPDDPARRVTVSVRPQKRGLADAAPPPPRPAAAAPGPLERPEDDTPPRMQEFQTNAIMTVSIFSKGNDRDKLLVGLFPQAISIESVNYPDGRKRTLRLELWDEIVPSISRYLVLPSKVELVLAKKNARKWPQLLRDDASSSSAPVPGEGNSSTDGTAEAKRPDAATPAQDGGAGPSYPTSSRRGPKDWDRIGAAAEEEDEDEAGDVNLFFKRLYRNATAEQQRAMTKSFTESNGTSLSTDWGDVKDRTVETVPPDGVVAKPWEK